MASCSWSVTPGRARYARTDIEMGAVFGSHVALALELARVHRLREELLVFTDRDRIARDLHDLVIQRLFAAGLSVQSLTRFTKDELALERIRDHHRGTGRGHPEPAGHHLLAQEQHRRHGAAQRTDPAGHAELGQVHAVHAAADHHRARWTLSRRKRPTTWWPLCPRASATPSGIPVRTRSRCRSRVVKGRMTVVITDNGSGFTEPAKRNGLDNIEDRARMLDGECTITSAPEAGTSLEWSVPL